MGQVAPEEMQLAGFCGEWSLKKVMAHILWHESEMIAMLETRSFGGSPYWKLPTDERNERILQEMRTLELTAVRAQASQTYEGLSTVADANGMSLVQGKWNKEDLLILEITPGRQ